jgi:hypothetical protein
LEFAGKDFFRRSPAFAWVFLFLVLSMGIALPLTIFGNLSALLCSVLVGNAVISTFFYVLGANELDDAMNVNVERSWFFIEAAQWMTCWYILKILVYSIGYLFYLIFIGLANLAILIFYWPRGKK